MGWIPDPRSCIRKNLIPDQDLRVNGAPEPGSPPNPDPLQCFTTRLAFILCVVFNTASSDGPQIPLFGVYCIVQFWCVFSQERERFLLAELLMIGCTASFDNKRRHRPTWLANLLK
jgi:hypothetical protein